nr:hypothetical protein [Evansella caseinilytica]
MKDEQRKIPEPVWATGIDDDEELSRKATLEEKKQGEYTKVVSLRYDENPKL